MTQTVLSQDSTSKHQLPSSIVLFPSDAKHFAELVPVIHGGLLGFIRGIRGCPQLHRMLTATFPEHLRDLPVDPQAPILWSMRIVLRNGMHRMPIVTSIRAHDARDLDRAVSHVRPGEAHSLTQSNALIETIRRILKGAPVHLKSSDEARPLVQILKRNQIIRSEPQPPAPTPAILDFPITQNWEMNDGDRPLLLGRFHPVVQPHLEASSLGALAIMQARDEWSEEFCRTFGINSEAMRAHMAKTVIISNGNERLGIGLESCVTRTASPVGEQSIFDEQANEQRVATSAMIYQHQRVLQERIPPTPFGGANSLSIPVEITVIACDDHFLTAFATIHAKSGSCDRGIVIRPQDAPSS